MKVITGLENWRPEYDRIFIALGNFDGVHLGHQEIIKSALAQASAVVGTAMVMVFEPHPEKLLNPGACLPLLTTWAEKERLLEKMGVDVLLQLQFNEIFRCMSPEEFVAAFLLGKLGVAGAVVGYNYRFGYKGVGTSDILRRLGRDTGLAVTVIPPVVVDGIVVSSTIIRQLLREGKIRAANSLLGRYFAITGTIVPGAQRGRYLGFPTANIRVAGNPTISEGVYLVRCRWAEQLFFGVANVGKCPTFGQGEIRIEINLFDFQGELYGEELTVEFIEYLRPEWRFATARELQKQIGRDICRARGIIAKTLSLGGGGFDPVGLALSHDKELGDKERRQ